jgi:hypothetical protein
MAILMGETDCFVAALLAMTVPCTTFRAYPLPDPINCTVIARNTAKRNDEAILQNHLPSQLNCTVIANPTQEDEAILQNHLPNLIICTVIARSHVST